MLLSLIAHALIEIGYLSWAGSRGASVIFYNGCALPPWLQAGLLIAGAVGGFFLGRYWWRWIYVDRTWEKNPKYRNKK